MEKLQKTINFFWSRLFALYVVFAGIATIVDFIVLAGLVELLGVHYLTSSAVAYLFGMLTNFTLNKFVNFKNKSNEVGKQFGLFAMVALIGLALNQLILYIMVEVAGAHYITGKAVSVLIVMFWSFFGHKKITFNFLR